MKTQAWSWTFNLGGRYATTYEYVAREESPGGSVHVFMYPHGVELDLGIRVRRAGTFDPRAAADAIEECLALIEKDIIESRRLIEEDRLDPSKDLAMAVDHLEARRVAVDRERAKIASVREQNPPSSASRWRVVLALLVTLWFLVMVVIEGVQVTSLPSFGAVVFVIAISGGFTLLWRWTRGKRMPAWMRHRIIRTSAPRAGIEGNGEAGRLDATSGFPMTGPDGPMSDRAAPDHSGDVLYLECFLWGATRNFITRGLVGATSHPTMDALVCELVIFDLPAILVCYFHERQLARANVNLLPERPADEVISYHFRTIRAALEERHGPAKVIPLRRAGPDRSEQTTMVYWVNARQVTMLSMGLLSDGLPESAPALGVSVADPNRDRPAAQLLEASEADLEEV